MKHLTFKEVKVIAQGRWDQILGSLVGSIMIDAIERGSQRHSPCPIHGGTKPFRVFEDFDVNGGCICSQCGAFSDGFSFLQELYGWSSAEALNQVAAQLGVSSKEEIRAVPKLRVINPKKITPEEIETRRLKIQALWHDAVSPEESGAAPMFRYFNNRGLTDLNYISPMLKMAMAHGYYEDGKFVANYSAIVAPLLNPEGLCVAIHRTYITYEGFKAPVESPKKLFTKGVDLQGSAIRLFNPSETLGVCEGIETAMAVYHLTKMPVWACVSAALLKNVQIPSGVKKVVIWADKDLSGTGQDAADHLAKRLKQQGLEVQIRLPAAPLEDGQKSVDWLDVLNQVKPISATTIRRTA